MQPVARIDPGQASTPSAKADPQLNPNPNPYPHLNLFTLSPSLSPLNLSP
jgi:hypothetical protein